tara:strand:- start:48 stop:257 length:210 start_codon:yes stop_codon:yes gene_type:complete
MNTIDIDGETFDLDNVSEETQKLVAQYFSGLQAAKGLKDELFIMEVGLLHLSETVKERILIDLGKITKQ